MGENTNNKLLLKDETSKITTPACVEFFDEKNAMKVFAGSNHTLLMTENMKIPKFRDEHKYTCEICNKFPIPSPLYVDPTMENELMSEGKILCADCVDKKVEILVYVKENVNGYTEISKILLEKESKEYLTAFKDDKK